MTGKEHDGDQEASGSVPREAVRLVAGIADLGMEAAEGLLRRARGVLGRADLPDLAADFHREVRAHGDVVLERVAPPARAHMEHLARRVDAVRNPSAKDAAGDADRSGAAGSAGGV